VDSVSSCYCASLRNDDLRRKEPPLACQNCNKHFIVLCDFEQRARKLVVVFSAQRIEFLGDVERDDGDAAAVVDQDGIFLGGGHCGSVFFDSICMRFMRERRRTGWVYVTGGLVDRVVALLFEPRSDVAQCGGPSGGCRTPW
jgi:hypothetical protein